MFLALLSMTVQGQSFEDLWKQANEAEQKDLPRTQYDVLMKIVKKAQQDGQYGHLMAAELAGSRVMSQIAPDSLQPAVDRMAVRRDEAEDPALKTVYTVVLKKIYSDNAMLEQRGDLTVTLDSETCAKLGAAKTADYMPLLIEGKDSRWFGSDMLSVMGYELKDYRTLNTYYNKAGNRVASLITALDQLRTERPDGLVELNDAPYLQRLDSLISLYSDLPEVAEVAMERFNYMANGTFATDRQEWDYLETALQRWGSYKRTDELRNVLAEMSRRQYGATLKEKLGIPGQGQELMVWNLRGVEELTVRLYAVDVDGDTELNPMVSEGYKALKPKLKELTEHRLVRTYSGKQPYEEYKDTIAIPALPVGVYMVETETKPATGICRKLYFVSGLRTMSEVQPNKRIRYVVVDAAEGQPVAGATLELRGYANGKSNHLLATLTTDAKGEATYDYASTRPYSIYTYTKGDKACLPMIGSGNFSYYESPSLVEHTRVFTDRSIYRPGQTVHVAAICYQVTNGINQQVQEGRSLTITLRDANRKVVAEQQVTTDRYGTCAADFTLPSNGLTGYFTVQAGNDRYSFRVEEYKRPTFEVTFDTVNEAYKDGDTLTVRGVARSYVGVPVQGAKVKYKVNRKRSFWWRAGFDNIEMAAGEAVTDDDGGFTAKMPMLLPKTKSPQFYNFVCTADVTDQAGETHQGQLSLPLGNRTTAFYFSLSEKVRADQLPKVTFHLTNAAGKEVAGSVQYRLDGGKWTTVAANQEMAIFKAPIKSGRHTLEATYEGDTEKKEFTVFSLDDQRPAAETDDWFYVSDRQFPNNGNPVTVQVGSSAQNVHIVYSIFSGGKVVESGSVERSDQLLNRKLNYKPEYGDGLLLTFAWVKQGRCYHHETTIMRPMPDKQLTMTWTTFRDRLTPGQQEEWTLTVKTPDGKPADAQLMATLYDKSLDQISSHQWLFTPYQYISLPNTDWQYNKWGVINLDGKASLKVLSVQPLSFSRLNEALFPKYFRYNKSMRWLARAANVEGKAMPEPMLMSKEMVDDTSDADQNVVVVGYAAKGADEKAASEEPPAEVQLRENLQETAFFYPQLQTDGQGLVTMKFTLPESLTTWRFMGLAHTTDLCYGSLSDETVAKKELMVQPNMPRFVRRGDEATISTRIINTGDNPLNGSAWLTLIDPETEETVLTEKADFAVDAGQTTSATFNVNSLAIKVQASLLIAKVVAAAGNFSDGEQHYLPILPNSERVTVTVPFTQNAPGTKAIDLTALFPQGAEGQLSTQSPKLTIEYTNNPVWLMIQALPAVGHPYDNCAVCQAAAYYANSIGKYIIDRVPQAKQTLEQWKRETGSETSLHSQLQKNQELKDLLLDETPWVADAEREAEQRQRLADFFDQNLMQQRLSSAIDKLAKLQRSDGSWSWWPEMPGSVYMTIAVGEMLTRLNSMTGQQSADTRQMLDGAFKFLGKEMVAMVNEIKKLKKKEQAFPGNNALQWLYICKIDGRQLPENVQQANLFLTKLLKQEAKSQSIYEKAMSAIILNSKDYIKSLKEYTVYKEDMGRYYDTPRAGYSWRDYRIPTQVAAIEALQRLAPEDYQTISEMKRWLLQEKRSQAWDTPLNSADAVYAFLNGQGGVKGELLATATAAGLKIDDKAIDTPQPTAGIGYVKTVRAYHGEKTFTAEKTSEGTSWGALYAQFMQPTVSITAHSSGVSVKREVLYADNRSPLAAHPSRLNVGSRVIVRLTVDSDRDLDFVQLQDKRAACMEPVNQKSGYNWRLGCYVTPRDNATNYYFDRLHKGHHVIETEYYIDRAGNYETGTCTVQCAYAPEYRGTTNALKLEIKE